MKSKQRYYVLTAVILTNLVVGITYIWSIISKELTLHHGWSAQAASLPYVLSLALVPFAMILGGKITDSGKPCYSIRIGSILWGLGLILCGLTLTPVFMTIGFGIVFGAGVGIITGSASATAVKWFPAKSKGTVSGIAMAAGAFSSVYMAFLFQWLLKTFGLSRSLLTVGIAGMAIMVLASWFIRSPKLENAPAASAGQPNTTESNDSAVGEMLRTSSFWKGWLILALGDSSALMIIGGIASIALYQAGIENAAFLVMVLNLSNGIGRIVIGNLSDRIGIRGAFFVALGLQLVNMLAFHLYTSSVLLTIGAAVTGFAFGGTIAMLNPSASKFGVSHLAVNAAVLNTSYSIGGLLMPYVSAYIVDHTGSYHMAYLVAAAMLIVALLVTVFYRDEVSVQEKSAVSHLRGANSQEPSSRLKMV